ncbi:hypothetical protein PBCV1_a483L [Paramecium bursaria Chlorella virus 1]|uniref:Uncharacterized protein n=1 Tax=Paramecium bursaria Chlorella virus 1 TaxID=10506 RepID=Q98533_PBCV1|nr:hypothetical protein PBCV1_a483L [Paramecium bursaria Chlorella virus 1]AAC96850.1 hypothetical protein [Paramecium bursaria Chlorella virus 1]
MKFPKLLRPRTLSRVAFPLVIGLGRLSFRQSPCVVEVSTFMLRDLFSTLCLCFSSNLYSSVWNGMTFTSLA